MPDRFAGAMANAKARRLAELYGEIRRDELYRNDRMGQIFVPGVGPTDSRAVLVGEAPGREEEILRLPFVGAAGRNLNALLQSIDWSRDSVFITNLLKYRPLTAQRGNRKPSVRESRYALPFLLRELQVLAPQVVVCLGSSAAAVLLDCPQLKMTQSNGQLFAAHGMEVFVTYHPSPLNYNNPAKKQTMQAAFARLRTLVHLG
jgi:uracil-DNA glycosylase